MATDAFIDVAVLLFKNEEVLLKNACVTSLLEVALLAATDESNK